MLIDETRRMLQALAWSMVLSLAAMLLGAVLFADWMGWL